MPNNIAVVIPCYNHAKELDGTLMSLSKQTLKPAEVVVVDDGSEHDPADIVDKYRGQLNIGYIRFESNRGAPTARNRGAEATVSPFLIFLDADAVLEPDALETMAKSLEQEGAVDFVYANFYWGNKKFPARPFDAEVLKKKNYIHTSVLMRRSAFPGFDESLKKFQDWDLWLTMAAHGSKGAWIDRYLFHVTPRKDGISSWLPSFVHKVPWPIFGWMPKEIKKYREAEKIIREKHGLAVESRI